MNRSPRDSGNDFDGVVGRALEAFAQRVSRRGLLARLGKAALGLMGLSLIPHLPVNRIALAQVGCSDWRLCGIGGYLCNNCCSGGNLETCPNCLTRGSSWSSCCTDPSGCLKMITYYDCCGSPTNAMDCRGTLCVNQSEPSWCGGTGSYGCTVIEEGAAC